VPRAPKHCGHYGADGGCRNLVRGRTYCEKHTPAPWTGSHRSKDTSTAKWKRLRLAVLERDRYLCQLHLDGCLNEANQADHIKPKYQYANPEAADIMTNLRAVCAKCHAKHSARQGGIASGEARRSGISSEARYPHQSSSQAKQPPVEDDWSPSRAVIRMR
jgi:5-methylcytosine-specific restriction enzyme A